MAGTCSSCAPSTVPRFPASSMAARAAARACSSSRLSTVEINNEIVALEQQEAEEVHRILLALTDTLRRRGDDVERTVGAATEFDVLQARASFSTLVERSASGHRDRRQARVASGAASAADSGRCSVTLVRSPAPPPTLRRRHAVARPSPRRAKAERPAHTQVMKARSVPSGWPTANRGHSRLLPASPCPSMSC